MKINLFVCALSLVVGQVAAAGIVEIERCQTDLLSSGAVNLRFEQVLRVIDGAEQMKPAFKGMAPETEAAVAMIAAVTNTSLVDVLSRFTEISARVKKDPALSRYQFGYGDVSQLVMMAADRSLTSDQVITTLLDVSGWLGTRRENKDTVFTLAKLNLYRKVPAEKLVTMLDEARRSSFEIEDRVRDRHAAVVVRYPDSKLINPKPWLSNELVMAAIESAVLADVPVHEAMARTEELLMDEVGAMYTRTEQEAVIKAAVVLGRPIADSLSKLGNFEARTIARFGEPIDVELEPLLIYPLLLGNLEPRDVVDYLDRVVVAGNEHGELIGLMVLARTIFEIAAAGGPHPHLLRTAIFNPFE